MKKSVPRLVILLPLGALLGSTISSDSRAAEAQVAAATTKPKATATTAAISKSVTRVEVNSDANHSYVLFAKPVAGSDWGVPVAIAKGQTATVLTDGRKQLPTAKYRVETFSNGKPGDVDADGIDDLTELNGAPALNALSAVKRLDPSDGLAIVTHRAAFDRLSYQGNEVARDSYLAGHQFVKFFITKANTPARWCTS